MLQLIEDYDHGDLERCWKWVYLSRLVGTDLTQDAHYAINEDGSDYDDDVGGPAYVAGRDGVDLGPLAPEQDTTARLAAQKLVEQIEQNAGQVCWLYARAVCPLWWPMPQSNRLIRPRVTI